jgi:hypothetical protein
MDPAAERLCIPVQESDEVVVVPVSQLPDDPQEVLNVLISEAAVLPLWLDFARTYLKQGDVEGFQKILQEASSEEVLTEVEQYFGKKPNYEHIQCLCGFVALSLARAKDEKDAQKRSELLNTARLLVQKAKQVDPKEQLPDLAAGMWALAKVCDAAASPQSRWQPPGASQTGAAAHLLCPALLLTGGSGAAAEMRAIDCRVIPRAPRRRSSPPLARRTTASRTSRACWRTRWCCSTRGSTSRRSSCELCAATVGRR